MNSPAKFRVTEDCQLVERAKSGDSTAFGNLVRKYETDVRAFIRQRIKDPATADDLAQEVFLGAMKSIIRFENSSSVRSWLISIARYKLIDHLRSEYRRKTTNNEFEAAFDQALLVKLEKDEGYEPEMLSALGACIRRLQPAARQLVDDYYFEDIPASEIAESRKQKSSTVRMALLRIRKALAKCMRKRLGGGLDP